MVMVRGEIWWADLGEPRGSEAGYIRPVIVVQEDAINRSQLRTTIAIPLTTNLRHGDIGANVLLPAKACQIDHDSAAQIHLIQAVPNERFLSRIGLLQKQWMDEIDTGLNVTLGLFSED